MSRVWTIAVLALLVLPAGVASACPGCTASQTCCLPGFALEGMHVALVFPILSAFIEAWFIRRAGVQRHSLALGLQANLLSMVATGFGGSFWTAFAWSLGSEGLILLWMVVAFALTPLIECAWLRRASPGLAVSWIWTGNLISTAVIFTLPMLRTMFGTSSHSHIVWVGPMREMIVLLTLAGAAVVFVVAFFRTGLAKVPSGHGFEVITASSPPASEAVEVVGPSSPVPPP